MKKLILGLVLLTTINAFSAEKSVEDRLADLEANQAVNIFKFGGHLDTYYDSIKLKQTPTTTSTASEENLYYFRLRAGINMNADVSERTKFYSRFVASKFFNKFSEQGTELNTRASSLAEGRKYAGGSEIYLEKAYADVKISDKWVFSFGRLSTVDGPYTNMSLNKARMGTYPYLAYNAVFDGFAVSYNTPVGEGSISARLIYTPFTSFNKGSLTETYLLSQPRKPSGSKDETTSELAAWMLEYENNKLSWVKSMNVIYLGYQTSYLTYDTDNDVPSSLIAAKKAGIISSVTSLGACGTGTSCAVAASGNTDTQFGAHNLSVGLENIASSGIDVGLTYLSSTIKNKNKIQFTLSGAAASNGVVSSQSMYGFGVSEEDGTATATATALNLKYNFNSKHALGGEYISNTKHIFIYNVGTTDITNFYSTPGNAYNIYYTTKLLSELTLKFAFNQQDYKYTSTSFGASSDSDRKITNYTAQLRLDF